jgi:hypothetical protein
MPMYQQNNSVSPTAYVQNDAEFTVNNSLSQHQNTVNNRSYTQKEIYLLESQNTLHRK